MCVGRLEEWAGDCFFTRLDLVFLFMKVRESKCSTPLRGSSLSGIIVYPCIDACYDTIVSARLRH